jgi:hypothetical protein
MPSLDDPFYARLLTLSDAELCTYIQQYAHYKVEAVHAALVELRMRGVYVSEDTVAEIDRYFTRHKQQRMRPFHLAPHHLRWLSYGMLTLGLGLAVLLYMTAASPSPYPLGYDPFTSKKYVRELELYGGKLNLLAVELHQWLASLWRGKALAYTVAVLTLMLASLVRPLSMRNRRKYPRPPQTHGHDRPQPAERGIAPISTSMYAQELVTHPPFLRLRFLSALQDVGC